MVLKGVIIFGRAINKAEVEMRVKKFRNTKAAG